MEKNSEHVQYYISATKYWYNEHFYNCNQRTFTTGNYQDLLLCCWKRMFVMTSAFSWKNSILVFALLHSIFQGQICLLADDNSMKKIMEWKLFHQHKNDHLN